MTKGIRWINGQEYLLAGRYMSYESAKSDAAFWKQTRIIKRHDYDYMLYQHGGRK